MTVRQGRAAIALVMGLVVGPGLAPRAGAQAPPRSGEAVVESMRARYDGRWYRTMTFVQRTTFPGRPDQTWYETVEVPGKLRIDVAPVDSMNAFMFIGDSTINFRRGQRVGGRAVGNILAVLIMDAFTAPVPETVARLRAHGFDLSRVSSGRFRDRPVWIVGATSGDTTVSQFWLDAERLHLVRMLEAAPGQPLTDIQVSGHVLMNGVWIEREVHVFRGGAEVQGEYYTEVTLDPPVDPAVWSTSRYVRPGWIPRVAP